MATNGQRSRLKSRYEDEIRPALIERFQYSTPMQAPVIRKITLNMGVGDAKQDSKVLEAATEQLATIAGQRPSVRRARKSIAAFKLREGMPVGVSVTLRGERSYEFLDRLMSVAIPRIRDFRGMNPRSFDGRGNYSLGVREQIIFPEIDYDAIDQTRGLDITITTSAKSDAEAYALLEAFGFPFARTETPAVVAPAPAPAAELEEPADERQAVDAAAEVDEQPQAADVAAAPEATAQSAAGEDAAAPEEPAAEEPAAEEPAAEEAAVAEEPAAEEAAVSEELPTEEAAVSEEPVAEEPAVAEELVAEEPVAEEPAAEEPVAPEPAAEQHVAEDAGAADETVASGEASGEDGAAAADEPATEPAPDAPNDQE
jgi:large subunit ribosomal protein L5